MLRRGFSSPFSCETNKEFYWVETPFDGLSMGDSWVKLMLVTDVGSHSGISWCWWPIGMTPTRIKMSPTYFFCRQQLKMVTIIKSPISLSPDSWVPGRCVLRPFVPIWSIKDSELINLFRPRDLVGFRLGNRVSCYSVRSPLFINIRFLGWWSTGGVLDSLVSVWTLCR